MIKALGYKRQCRAVAKLVSDMSPEEARSGHARLASQLVERAKGVLMALNCIDADAARRSLAQVSREAEIDICAQTAATIRERHVTRAGGGRRHCRGRHLAARAVAPNH
jgi:hypothetical protein